METTTWICDTCRLEIENANAGWIEWQDGQDRQSYGLRLVHHNKVACRYPDSALVSNGHLQNYLGEDGLMKLIALARPKGYLPTEEVFEMIKRLFIPGYEKARLRADDAASEGVFSPNMQDGIYFQYQIKAIIDWIDEGN